MPRWVFWQNILAFYQVPHLTALANMPGNEVVWVVERLLDQDRVAQGWTAPEVPNVTVIVAPDDAKIDEILNDRASESVNVFSGIHFNPTVRKAFYKCLKTKSKIGLLTEPPIPGSSIRNMLIRPYHILHRLLYGGRINLILAIGNMGYKFYRSIGFPDSVVYTYGYFPQLLDPPAYKGPRARPVRLMYLGQLIERKGLDILLQALGKIKDLDWILNLMGSGPEKEALAALASQVGISERVSFSPSAKNALAMEAIAESDVFLLPSRHDGWGAVVNESLMCGVPVICSDHCGALDLLTEDWRGNTFTCGSEDDLAKVLTKWIERGPRTESETKRIQEWCSRITGRSVAAYIVAALQYSDTPAKSRGVKPQAPWFT